MKNLGMEMLLRSYTNVFDTAETVIGNSKLNPKRKSNMAMSF